MYRKNMFLLILGLIAALCFAGCRENTPTEPEQSQLSSGPSQTDYYHPTQATVAPEPSGMETIVPDVSESTGTGEEATGTTPTEAITQPSTGPHTDPSTEPSAGSSTDSSTEPSTEPSTKPSTEPTTEPTTKPSTEPSTESTTVPPTESDKPQLVIEYEEYQAMSGTEQQKFAESFPGGIPAFVSWYNAAKEAYKAYYPEIEIGEDGSVDLGGNN